MNVIQFYGRYENPSKRIERARMDYLFMPKDKNRVQIGTFTDNIASQRFLRELVSREKEESEKG